MWVLNECIEKEQSQWQQLLYLLFFYIMLTKKNEKNNNRRKNNAKCRWKIGWVNCKFMKSLWKHADSLFVWTTLIIQLCIASSREMCNNGQHIGEMWYTYVLLCDQHTDNKTRHTKYVHHTQSKWRKNVAAAYFPHFYSNKTKMAKIKILNEMRCMLTFTTTSPSLWLSLNLFTSQKIETRAVI